MTTEARRVLFVGHTGRARGAARGARRCPAFRRLRGHGARARRRGRRAGAARVDVDRPPSPRPPRAASSSWCSAATARCFGPPSSRGRAARRCSGSTSATWASSPRPSRDALAATVDRVVARDYASRSGMTIDVDGQVDGAVIGRGWALNEASVEKASRQRMLEVVIEVDGRPLSRWGCDGVVFATPTGSTAYAFSAGGPVVWPEVDALLLVPISAHALFARPLVASPRSVLAVEVLSEPGRRRAVVRRAPYRAAAVGRPHRGAAWRAAGAARAAAHRAVHRPAGGEVRPAGARLARCVRRGTVTTTRPSRPSRA